MKFTIEQEKAIEFNGNMVLTACPGSGKTAVVVEKIIKDIGSCKDFEGVIAISYTNKASDELKERCQKKLPDIKASFFGTMDKFYLKEVVFKYINHAWGRCEKINLIKYDKLPQDWQDYLAEYLLVNDVADDIEVYDFSKLESLYVKGYLVLEFIPLLTYFLLNKSFACNVFLKSKYKSLYIDEYQDSGYIQHKIFMHLSGLGIKSIAVGDVDQSIYAYAARSPEYLLSLTRRTNYFKWFEITLNHRSHPSIVNYANRLMNEDSKLIDEGEINVFHAKINGGHFEVANWIDESIPIVKEVYGIKHEANIGVLLASKRSVSLISNALKVMNRAYIDDDLSKMNDRLSILIGNLIHYKFNKLTTAQKIIDELDLGVFNRERVRIYRRLIQKIRTANSDELIPMLRSVIKEITGSELRTIHIDALNEILESKQAMNNYLPKNSSEVQVMTLHKSKGLEFDFVFHLDLYDYILPRREIIKGCYDEVFTNYQQCLNLHYVGVTRAKKGVALITSSSRLNAKNEMIKAKPSQFLTKEGIDGLFKSFP